MIDLLESFPMLKLDSLHLMTLIDDDVLSAVTELNKLELHVKLCVALLIRDNGDKKAFYQKVLSFTNQEWTFTFVSGLLKAPQIDEDSIKLFIVGETFMPKLLENVTQQTTTVLTEDGAAVLISVLKFGKNCCL